MSLHGAKAGACDGVFVTTRIASTSADRTSLSEPVEAPSPQEFLNRDLSWLEFNRRVLNEAADERTPLLERVRFLAIFNSNLDEFFMKRVGAIREKVRAGKLGAGPDGLTPAQHLSAIRDVVTDLQRQQAECYRKQVLPALAQQNIWLLRWDQLTEEEREGAQRYFYQNIFPVLTPLAVDPGHPFPFMSNLSESLGVVLRHPERPEKLFARIKVPETFPRWIRLERKSGSAASGSTEYRFASVYDIIRHNLDNLFPDMKIGNVMVFRVTRTTDLDVEGDENDDVRELVVEELRARRFAPVVRLELGPDSDPWMRQFLMQELELNPVDVYDLHGEIDYQDLRPIADLAIPSLHYEPWTPTTPLPLADEEGDIFAAIRAGDILVHHPYESFASSVERFISAAADDPKVLAIKMTLYRTGDESPFIRTLIRAAESHKQVVCLVELKARFDEERNIQLAHALEKAGVHVVYGVVGLKTHTKTALVVRQDPDGIRCYAHVGTGNYHIHTARLYTDLGILTCDPELTGDLVDLFHYLTGRSLKKDYRKLLVAPVNMRQRFMDLIAREIEHRKAGRPAQIIAKMNSLEDRKVIRLLYDASRAGLEVELIVRGFCCLRPGVPGMSENIRVMSIVGRFLEHSRIYHFRNGATDPADGEFYIGSADWMYRNLLARVEVVTPVEDRKLRRRLWEILQISLADNRQAWDMQPDGTYVQRRPAPGEAEAGTHATLMALARQRAAGI